ncbi:MAG: DUF2232 domain-containing protein [Erysipelotrichaceae bacterium]|nr:DUF2232 domain-containing protein [Erysipelotrichaceae bacterium]
MNSTRKLTYGAMLLALLGAFMLIDRYLLALYFDEFVFLLQALIIIIYAAKYTFKDSVWLCIGIAALTFLFGGTTSWVYCPLAIIGGLAYSYGLLKDWERKKLLLVTFVIFIAGELLLTILIMPLFGITIEQSIQELQVSMETIFANTGTLGLISSDMLKNLMTISFGLAIVLTGGMEAMLIHLSAVILLKRFRIREIKVTPLNELKISPLYSYLAIFGVILMFFQDRFADNRLLFLTVTTFSLCCAIFLLVLGFIFVSLYGRIVLRRNIVFLVVIMLLFLPGAMYILILLGFLYGSGPLRDYLETKRGAL